MPSVTTAFNPDDYGADPTGVLESTAAIQAAIDAAVAANGVVQFSAGTYLIDVLHVTGSCTLQGADVSDTIVLPSMPSYSVADVPSVWSTTLRAKPNAARYGHITVTGDNVMIRRIAVDGDHANQTYRIAGIFCDNAGDNGVVIDCHIFDTGWDDAGGAGCKVYGVSGWQFINCLIEDTANDVLLSLGSHGCLVTGCRTYGCYSESLVSYNAAPATSNLAYGNTFSYNTVNDARTALKAQRSYGNTFEYNTIVACARGVYVDAGGTAAGYGNTVRGNIIYGIGTALAAQGIYVSGGATETVVDGNTIEDWSASGCYPMYVDVAGTTLTNNTVRRSEMVYLLASGIVFTGNTVAHSTNLNYAVAFGGSTYDGCSFENNTVLGAWGYALRCNGGYTNGTINNNTWYNCALTYSITGSSSGTIISGNTTTVLPPRAVGGGAATSRPFTGGSYSSTIVAGEVSTR